MRHIYLVVIAVLIASIPSLAEAAEPSVAARTNGSSLLTSTELEGATSAPLAEPNLKKRDVNPAMLASLEAAAQIRRVELILKSGPAQNGDLRVVQSGKPDPNQK